MTVIATLLAACASDTRPGVAPEAELSLGVPSESAGPRVPLGALGISAPLPAGAKVESSIHDGVRRAGITSLQPELVLDVEEADALSARYDEVLQLASSPAVPGDRATIRHNALNSDGTFAIAVEHQVASKELGQLVSYTLDMRVRAGARAFDCAGTASSVEALQRMAATCEALRPN